MQNIYNSSHQAFGWYTGLKELTFLLVNSTEKMYQIDEIEHHSCSYMNVWLLYITITFLHLILNHDRSCQQRLGALSGLIGQMTDSRTCNSLQLVDAQSDIWKSHALKVNDETGTHPQSLLYVPKRWSQWVK